MSAVVLPAAISHFTSTQVIFSNSTRSVCAHGSCSQYQVGGPANDQRQQGIRNRTNAHLTPRFPRQREFRNTMDAPQVIPQLHYSHDYNAAGARFCYSSESALGDPYARRFTRPRRVRSCRVHRRCSRSSVSDALRYYPASAKAGGCIGCRVARPLDKASASELARRPSARTSTRSTAADGDAEISYVERCRTSRTLAHRALASLGRENAYRPHSRAD